MTKKHSTRTLSYIQRILTLFIVVCFTLACSPTFAQTAPASAATNPAAAPAFDVATIKPHKGMLIVTGVIDEPDGVNGSAATLQMLIVYAYGLQSEAQVSGGPDWAQTDRYDVNAKIATADIAEMDKLSRAEKKTHRRQMLQALLADRFQLKIHPANKQTPVYDLVVAKGGPKLKDAATDGTPAAGDSKPPTGYIRFLKNAVVAKGYSMPALADFLSEPLAGVGRPVVDKTGLTGTYDFTLDGSISTAPAGIQAVPTSSDPADAAASIFTALGDVGLKLQPSTGPIQTIVIDHAERPSEN